MSNESEKDLNDNEDIEILDLDSDNTEKAVAETGAASSIDVDTSSENSEITESSNEEIKSEKAESEPAPADKDEETENKDEINSSVENADEIEILSADTVPDDNDNNVLVPDNRKYHFTTGDIIRYIILAIAIGVFVFAASKLIPKLISYKKEAANNKHIENEVVSENNDSTIADNSHEEYKGINPTLTVDFDKLIEINKDSVGWIHIPSIGVKYPIVHGKDNEYYLRHDITNNFAWSGAIYLDYRNDKALNEEHSTIYGHHMNDGTMFSYLIKYDSEDFFKKNQQNNNNYVYVYLKDKINVYQIFAVVDAFFETDPQSFMLHFSSDYTKQDFLNHIKEKQLYDTGISANENDTLLTLFTCQSGSSSDERHIVHSKLIKEILK